MASDVRSRLPSADGSVRGRLLDGRKLGFDLLAVATWVLGVAAVLHDVAVPAWLYYGVVAAGVVAYSLLAAWAEGKRTRTRRERHTRR